jgi:hypothetical protein
VPYIATFISNKQFCFLFLFSLYYSAKSESRRVEQLLAQGVGLAPVGREREGRKVVGG